MVPVPPAVQPKLTVSTGPAEVTARTAIVSEGGWSA